MWNKVPFAFLALLTGNENVSLLLRKAVIYLWWCLVWFNHFVFLRFAEPQVSRLIHFFHHLCPHNPQLQVCLPRVMCGHSPHQSALTLGSLLYFCKSCCAEHSSDVAGAVALPHEVGAAFFDVKREVLDWNINPIQISFAWFHTGLGYCYEFSIWEGKINLMYKTEIGVINTKNKC